MKKLDLFLFGAGASHGARSVDSPPLGTNLHIYVRDYLCVPKVWRELGILEEPADGTRTAKIRLRLKDALKAARDYEDLVTKLMKRGKSWPEKLNLLMAYSLTPPINDDPKFDNAFVEKPDVYDQFIRKRFPNMSALEAACFITLNYDCLLERALCRCYHHPADPNELRCSCSCILDPPTFSKSRFSSPMVQSTGLPT